MKMKTLYIKENGGKYYVTQIIELIIAKLSRINHLVKFQAETTMCVFFLYQTNNDKVLCYRARSENGDSCTTLV